MPRRRRPPCRRACRARWRSWRPASTCAMPTDAVRPPVASYTARLSRRRSSHSPSVTGRGRSGLAARSTNASSSDSGSTSGEIARSSAITARLVALVGVETADEERGVRAPRPRLGGRHRRADAELARLVRRRGDHAATADAADDDRLAAQRRLVPLLDGGEEGVEVQMQDRRLGSRTGHHRRRRRPQMSGRPSPRSCAVGHAVGMSTEEQSAQDAPADGTDRPDRCSRLEGPADIVAMVPYLLGFHPAESLVVVALTGPANGSGPCMRIDLVDARRSRSAGRATSSACDRAPRVRAGAGRRVHRAAAGRPRRSCEPLCAALTASGVHGRRGVAGRRSPLVVLHVSTTRGAAARLATPTTPASPPVAAEAVLAGMQSGAQPRGAPRPSSRLPTTRWQRAVADAAVERLEADHRPRRPAPQRRRRWSRS